MNCDLSNGCKAEILPSSQTRSPHTCYPLRSPWLSMFLVQESTFFCFPRPGWFLYLQGKEAAVSFWWSSSSWTILVAATCSYPPKVDTQCLLIMACSTDFQHKQEDNDGFSSKVESEVMFCKAWCWNVWEARSDHVCRNLLLSAVFYWVLSHFR